MTYNFSFWEYDSFLNDIDVAIIGSGIVGLSAAIQLKKKEPKLNIIVLERGPLPIGASTRNAGFACIGSMTEILDDLEHHSEEEVFGLVEKRYVGLRLLRETLGDKTIQYRKCGGFEIFDESEMESFEKCMDKMAHFNQILHSITGSENTFKEVSNQNKKLGLDGIKNLIINEVEGSIHTGEMMKSLLNLAQSEGVAILGGVDVRDINDDGEKVHISIQDTREIVAHKTIIATNALAHHLTRNQEVVPARNQVLLTNKIPGLQLEGTFHYKKGYVYFRDYENRVLIGGFRHLDEQNETTTEFGSSDTIQNALKEFLDTVLLKDLSYKIDYQWSGIMGVGPSKKPIIKNISNNCVAAIRLGGMGVAIGSIVGKEAAELILQIR